MDTNMTNTYKTGITKSGFLKEAFTILVNFREKKKEQQNKKTGENQDIASIAYFCAAYR